MVDRNCSWGKGGIFADEIKSAMSDVADAPMIYSYIAGLGGRSITPDDIRDLIRESMEKERPESESVWKGLKQ